MGSQFIFFKQKNSWLEQWDPRMKIVVIFLYAISLFVHQNTLFKAIQIVLLICLWAVAKLSWRMLGWTLLSLSLFFVTTMVYHMLFSAGSQTLQIFGFHLSKVGIFSGISMCLQIAGIVLLLSLLVRTTSPIILAEGLERLLSPFQKWKFPIHEATMMFSIALRFIPILTEEFEKVRKAQIARGNGFHRGKIRARITGLFPILMPMFILSILRAKELAASMESRCYDSNEKRTPIRQYRLKLQDYIIFICSVVLVIISVIQKS
ncbi:energy-coupling factor transport system permease protein [Seinonella peptonophila]|uniref:Energy-coupling factor transport system permease protein n=1 Tax=Seinonella peptonophila TaxID=112248 RepID=A0A1M5BA46_9BACL|nr:energy-coupling factor transporter transmembrane component T [Seinonella peptonophila]SHF39369.1 energy-coupling factor transport system permease protein [Seinonella peptonophila]